MNNNAALQIRETFLFENKNDMNFRQLYFKTPSATTRYFLEI